MQTILCDCVGYPPRCGDGKRRCAHTERPPRPDTAVAPRVPLPVEYVAAGISCIPARAVVAAFISSHKHPRRRHCPPWLRPSWLPGPICEAA